MKKSRYKEEQIVSILREAESSTGGEQMKSPARIGYSLTATARQHGVAEQTIYRWRRQFSGMEVSDVRELRRLRDENARLKKLLAERDLEVEVMKEIQAKKW